MQTNPAPPSRTKHSDPYPPEKPIANSQPPKSFPRSVMRNRRFEPIGSASLPASTFLVFTMGIAVAGPAAGMKMSLVIGIDGLGFGTRGFSAAPTPVMDDLIEGNWSPGYQGAYNDDAFAGGYLNTPTQQATFSGPGWSTILTGVWRDRHNVNDNGQSYTNGNFAENPDYLTTLKLADSTIWTGVYVWWFPTYWNIYAPLFNDGVAGNEPDFANFYATSYSVLLDGGDENLVVDAVAGIAALGPETSGAIFVAFDTVDHWGHVSGSSSQDYQDAITRTDERVGQLLDAVSSRPGFANEDWQIVITSDHGHEPLGGHGGQSSIERTIPLIVASKQVVQGRAGPPPGGVPISHADVAPTVLEHFGMAIPDRYAGQSRARGILPDFTADGQINGDDLQVFEQNFGVVFRNAPLHSDGNSDGDFDVDGADFIAWQRHADAAATTVVPEPKSFALLAWVIVWKRRSARIRFGAIAANGLPTGP